MDNDKIARKILESLVKTGVCKTGQRYLKTTMRDLDILIKVWKRWPEYYCEHYDIAIKTVRKFINEDTKKILSDRNIFVDYTGNLELNSDNSVFFVGDSDCEVIVRDFAVVKMYVLNSAKIHITNGNNSIMFIEAYNESNIFISDKSTSKTIGYKYDNASISGIKDIRIHKYKRGEIFNGKELQNNYDYGNNI